MSHFTVLVIGEDPETQLAPFNENLKVEYVDKTEEYRQEYETKKAKEFYCNSNSSWGFELTKEMFEELQKSKVGRVLEYNLEKKSGLSYLQASKKYRGYYMLEDRSRCKNDVWFEVDSVVETTHPDKDICFNGVVRLRKIAPPKKIALKDKYPVYGDYLRDWHGIDDINRQGYDHNPQAKWDWYQLGGRWTGFFKLKPTAKGTIGDFSLISSRRAETGTADQARKCDIDFDGMRVEKFEEASKSYDEYESRYEKGELKPGEAYWVFGVENVGKDANDYIPESRERYIKRVGSLTTFAVLKDGNWYEKGNMGWWGMVSDEKGPGVWVEEFNKLIDGLPDDTLLSLYDCHI